jgi:hypothetical protein
MKQHIAWLDKRERSLHVEPLTNVVRIMSQPVGSHKDPSSSAETHLDGNVYPITKATSNKIVNVNTSHSIEKYPEGIKI